MTTDDQSEDDWWFIWQEQYEEDLEAAFLENCE